MGEAVIVRGGMDLFGVHRRRVAELLAWASERAIHIENLNAADPGRLAALDGFLAGKRLVFLGEPTNSSGSRRAAGMRRPRCRHPGPGADTRSGGVRRPESVLLGHVAHLSKDWPSARYSTQGLGHLRPRWALSSPVTIRVRCYPCGCCTVRAATPSH